MNKQFYGVMLVAVMALVTAALRFAPFLFLAGRKTPAAVSYLGRVLPYAVMGMLVVYCLRNVSLLSAPFGLPELLACLCVVSLHLWRRNTMLSIIGGTAVYMLLTQFVF